MAGQNYQKLFDVQGGLLASVLDTVIATRWLLAMTTWRWNRRPYAFAATSSSPRLRGSTPQAHTTTIWMITRAIISQITPGSA
jgi:hypothetical protein